MVPYSKEGGWNIPAVGRWIGIVVVVSALVGGAYNFIWVVANARANEYVPDEMADRFLLEGLTNVWRSVLSLGSSGVIVFLLAEIMDRLTWDDNAEESESPTNGESRDDLES